MNALGAMKHGQHLVAWNRAELGRNRPNSSDWVGGFIVVWNRIRSGIFVASALGLGSLAVNASLSSVGALSGGMGTQGVVLVSSGAGSSPARVALDHGKSDNSGNSGNSGNSSNSGKSDNSGNSSNSGDSGNSGNSSNSGNSGNSSNSGNSGNSSNSGNSGNSSNSGNSGNSGGSSNSGGTSTGDRIVVSAQTSLSPNGPDNSTEECHESSTGNANEAEPPGSIDMTQAACGSTGGTSNSGGNGNGNSTGSEHSPNGPDNSTEECHESSTGNANEAEPPGSIDMTQAACGSTGGTGGTGGTGSTGGTGGTGGTGSSGGTGGNGSTGGTGGTGGTGTIVGQPSILPLVQPSVHSTTSAAGNVVPVSDPSGAPATATSGQTLAVPSSATGEPWASPTWWLVIGVAGGSGMMLLLPSIRKRRAAKATA